MINYELFTVAKDGTEMSFLKRADLNILINEAEKRKIKRFNIYKTEIEKVVQHP